MSERFHAVGQSQERYTGDTYLAIIKIRTITTRQMRMQRRQIIQWTFFDLFDQLACFLVIAEGNPA